MKDNRHGHHTITPIDGIHRMSTKYCYYVLEGNIKVRYRDWVMHICDFEDVRIVSGVVSKDFVHIHIE